LRGNAVARLAAAVAEIAGAPVALERPSDPAHGDYATNVALRHGGGRPPRERAQEIADAAAALPQLERAEIAGPGFVNLFVTDAFLVEAVDEIDEGYAGGFADPREKVQVELVSANPTGPLTIGSARNGAYGDSVARLLEFAGHEVEREYYYNDAGAQMERFRRSVEARRRGEPAPEDGYQGAYVDELAQAEGDPVPAMLERIEATLERFRVHVDSWVRESVLQERLDETLALLDTYEADGALWVRSTRFGDDKDRVLVRSAERGGLATYEASDAIYIRDKFERGFQRLIYVLGYDHQGVANWYRTLARILGYDEARVEVLLYQLVHLKRSGDTVKMGKRSGNVVFLDDLVDEIGVDAARWYLVSRDHAQPIDIDVDLAAEKTQKNPVYYVQYAHARIAGILRNAGDARVGGTPAGALAPEERDLVKRLAEFPGVVAEATARRAPHAVPLYAIRVADDFHRFYHEHRVLESDSQAFRLGLVRAAQRVIARALDLIGVEAPERM
jgi:arginyl-tRNA synthetase